jgi:hypothetical protein
VYREAICRPVHLNLAESSASRNRPARPRSPLLSADRVGDLLTPAAFAQMRNMLVNASLTRGFPPAPTMKVMSPIGPALIASTKASLTWSENALACFLGHEADTVAHMQRPKTIGVA